jgi:hypothetical protein
MHDVKDSGASETKEKSTWRSGVHTRLSALPMWGVWLVLFGILFLSGEIIGFFFKTESPSRSIQQAFVAGVTASGLSFFHWLDRKKV